MLIIDNLGGIFVRRESKQMLEIIRSWYPDKSYKYCVEKLMFFYCDAFRDLDERGNLRKADEVDASVWEDDE